MMKKSLIGLGVAGVAAAALLAGCGGDSAGTQHSSTTAPPSAAGQQAGHNQQDVKFAQDMIAHHQQALDMAAMIPAKSTNPKVTDLGKRIAAAQDPEIRTMTEWLAKWGATPATSMPGMDHGSGHGSMPGMMTAEEMAKLNGATGTEFERTWLDMMIKHHQGAVEMAEVQQEKGSDAGAKQLAQDVIAAQQAEITEMQNLLKSS
ncbi:DUF305 domain-containing protein [Lentzea sp. NPDC102401]|uniref:DUF305 domain-containing protein n=1 Tax=Lentzea sp. NPDC102401 TaxID=3364128 RepID=UPI00381350DF